MTGIMNRRNRVSQSLILVLIALTFYVYYGTTIDIRAIGSSSIHGDELLTEMTNSSSNRSRDNATSDQLPKNSTSLKGKSNAQNQTSVMSPILPSIAVRSQLNTSSSSIPLSTSYSVSAINGTKMMDNLPPTHLSPTKPPRDDTSGAIYRFGHDLSIPERCPDQGENMDLVIIVASAPNHIKARMAIRLTWGHFGQRRDVSVVFMLGLTNDKVLEKSLVEEEKLWSDVIRGRYYDSYSNLTLKTISSFEWMSTYCSKAKFMLKTDDDMFINVPRLLAFISNHKDAKNVIYGRLANKWAPVRNKKSKYYLPENQYKPSVFPNFTTGPAYLLPFNVIEKLYVAALNETYLKLEDVFMTGVVAEKIGIKRSHVKEFLNKRISFDPCKIKFAISIHMVSYAEQLNLWSKLLDGKAQCKY